MYCSVVRKVIGGWLGRGCGAIKAEGYHWERKPYGCSYSFQKKMASSDEVEADIFRQLAVRGLMLDSKILKIEDESD